MLALQDQYYVKSEGGCRKQMSKDDLKRLFYSLKTTLSFTKYLTKMDFFLNLLYNYNVPLYEDYKVKQRLDNINFPKNCLKIRLTSTDLETVLNLKQLPHTYQQLYHAFAHRPRHHQEGIGGDGRSTHLVEDK